MFSEDHARALTRAGDGVHEQDSFLQGNVEFEKEKRSFFAFAA
jgi:hypothetical protein